MRQHSPYLLKLAGTVLLTCIWPLLARSTPQLAIDKGCYSCHGSYLRGEAPSFERLRSKLSKYHSDKTAEQKFLDKFLAGEPFQHIDAHERLTRESAQNLILWLDAGSK